jgi:hypothetical protein
MSAVSQLADPTACDANGAHPSGDEVPNELQRIQMLDLRATLDAQNIALLQKENKELEDALEAEQARAEKHADALMRIARTSDDRSSELKDQHAAVIRVKETLITKLEQEKAALQASNAALIAKLEGAAAAKDGILTEARTQNATLQTEIAALKVENGALKAEVRVLQAQATSKLANLHAAIAALHVLLPPPPPPLLLAPMAFDRKWCNAACGKTWKVDFGGPSSIRAHITQEGAACLTLRSAAPLPRPLSSLSLAAADGRQQQDQLPAYRIVIESYGRSECRLGFLPSHHSDAAAALVTPVQGYAIWAYGGWHIEVRASTVGSFSPGWIALKPSRTAADEVTVGPDTSAYATTLKVPRVTPGSAVEFAVDYVAGTCRVAFYTPAAVAGGFVEAPYAKMELRFVATEANGDTPARTVPTLPNSGVDLYPAADSLNDGAVWRFAS